jgi:hypothetical protein
MMGGNPTVIALTHSQLEQIKKCAFQVPYGLRRRSGVVLLNCCRKTLVTLMSGEQDTPRRVRLCWHQVP